MVILTQVLGYATKLPRNFRRRGLIDSLRLHVAGGAGGSGLPRYGGIGGAGGNVYVISENNLILKDVKHRLKDVNLKAGTGGTSTKKGLIGVPGTDLNISIPNGITVYDENRIKLGQVNSKNPKLMVAKGGKGGCENTGYCGLKGEKRTIVLDLQLLADVGLIGFPNAGKSTFLSAISKAKPKIADYPFTTIRPQIGTVTYKDYRQISVADLPGLIEGAHVNKGMGHKFLKHIERTKLLLFIVDIHGCQVSFKHVHRSCLETVLLLNKEIELYNPDLLERPAMIIINKMDMEGANEIYDEIKPKLNNLSEFLSEFDEAIQPKRVLQFDDILTASLKSKDADEMLVIKEKIRFIIDKYEEEKAFAEDMNSNEDNLLANLKRRAQQFAPTLI
ncbi:GTP-binding protein 10 like protein [Habropoda laboriosa]|uniref:GTP-binding protein 10 like protein n=1 Tax=Habropoda laboriosa TaxID=597456 RepID=A0A0L7RDH8_9HYME|nr:PREDICTED: GTP-binding protein 10 homolog [Habropoda laboriosa]KOC68835.1 GTP-binding protein 10 like protein [Habropoda laboriosa]